MIFPYLAGLARVPQPSLHGGVQRYRPILSVRITGPTGSQQLDALLDSGSDDTIFPAWVAALVGLDLSQVPDHDLALAGRPQPVRSRFERVALRITDGVSEICEWSAVVGFVPVPMNKPLLGQAGCLQFFNADFRGADHEVILTANPTFPGQRTAIVAGNP